MAWSNERFSTKIYAEIVKGLATLDYSQTIILVEERVSVNIELSCLFRSRECEEVYEQFAKAPCAVVTGFYVIGPWGFYVTINSSCLKELAN